MPKKLLPFQPTESLKELCRARYEVEDKIRWYFRYSELWKAIREHIEKNYDTPLIDRMLPLVYHRGTGSCLNVKEVVVYGLATPQDPTLFQLTISATFFDEDNDREVTREYELDVPFFLEENFSKKAFGEWIKVKSEERYKERHATELETLATLLKKYPREAGRLRSK